MNEKGTKLDRYDALSKEATKSLMQNRLKPVEAELDLELKMEEELNKNVKPPEKKEASNMKNFIRENSPSTEEDEYIRPSAKRLASQGISLNEKEKEERRRSLDKEPVFVQNKRRPDPVMVKPGERVAPRRAPQNNRPQRQAVDPFTRRSPNKPKQTPLPLYIGGGAALLFLGFFLFLIVSFFRLRGQVNYLEEQLYVLEPYHLVELENRVSELEYVNAQLTEQNNYLNDVLDRFEASQNFVIAGPGNYVPNYNNDDSDEYYVSNVGVSVSPTGATTHIVQSGQSLSSIAAQHFGSSAQIYIDAIMAANNMANPNVLAVDQELTIPNRPTE